MLEPITIISRIAECVGLPANEPEVAELADMLLEDVGALLDTLKPSRDGTLVRAAHTLKSHFMLFGCHSLAARFANLEAANAGRLGSHSASLPRLRRAGQAVCHRLAAELAGLRGGWKGEWA